MVPKITGPVTRAMKKLMDHKNAAQLAINVLCNLSKQHCAMCEWEQDCSNNPLLFDPVFARQYIKECNSWFINKQSVCAKCKLQLGQHLIDNQAQNDTTNAQISTSSCSINCQCHNFEDNTTTDSTDAHKFDFFSSKELINLQNELHAQNNQNLIKAHNDSHSEHLNQHNNALSD
jgi:hypothetical protein